MEWPHKAWGGIGLAEQGPGPWALATPWPLILTLMEALRSSVGDKASGGAGGGHGAAGTLRGLAAAVLDALFISRQK